MSKNSGQAIIMLTLFFLILSASFLVAISSPILRQDAMTNNFFNSRKSYFLAESGIEDAVYRIKTGKAIGSSETLSFNKGTVDVSVTSSSASKNIEADSNLGNLIRKISVSLKTGYGQTFHYGVQAGNGGFVINNNATVSGSVFADGPILGQNGASVTGSAVSASSSLTGSSVDNLLIGTNSVGDATAQSVTNSNVAGVIYCQIGSHNNKSCNTSYTVPSPAEFPISQSEIDKWKSDASAGGVINGDYTVTADSSIGPKKIVGNLLIDGKKVLTITGTLWVTGTVILNNGAKIQLSSSYGGNSGFVLADGRVSISNNSTFAGSGQTGSYILMITTSNCLGGSSCGGTYAIDISNNVGAVVLNAQNGALHLNNNAVTKEATAYKIILDNGATVSYESGLADMTFSSGPSGGWNVTSWQEVP